MVFLRKTSCVQDGATSYVTSLHYLNMQNYDGRPGQLFNIRSVRNANGDIDQGVFKIFSVENPTKVLSLAESITCTNNTAVILREEGTEEDEKWIVTGGGTIENFKCKGMVIDISSYQDGANIQDYKANNEWGQKWSIKSKEVVLAATSDDKSKTNNNQTWTPRFIDVGYDLGIHPGFPGVDDTTCAGSSCLSSVMDRDLAKKAMGICDESMSFLVGSQLSVGTLKSIADSVESGGPERMPGYCCMDVATNSEFFGFNVSILIGRILILSFDLIFGTQ